METQMEGMPNNQSQPLHDDLLAKQKTQLSNSDFRKLLLSKASSRKSHGDTVSTPSHRNRVDRPKLHGHKPHKRSSQHSSLQERRKKKPEERAEVVEGTENDGETGISAPRYRDRARERREGKVASNMEGLDTTVPAEGAVATADTGAAVEEDHEEEDHSRIMRTADYRSVAPTAVGTTTYAAERRRAIEESKYFGGDMEHTHLVKGLDFVLLEKVRRVIKNTEVEAERQLDDELDRPIGDLSSRTNQDLMGEHVGQVHFKSRLAEGIFSALFRKCNDGKVERNEYFQPGRMAYRVELEDEMAEYEVPATVIRSKADCHIIQDQTTTPGFDLSTNDIVINKLAQIFAYTRAGRRQAKKAKAAKRAGGGGEYDIQPAPPEPLKKKPRPIFDDAPATYVPSRARRRGEDNEDNSDNRRRRHHHRHDREDATNSKDEKYRSKTSSGSIQVEHQQAPPLAPPQTPSSIGSRYFDKPVTEDAPVKSTLDTTKDFIQQLAKKQTGKGIDDQANLERLLKKTEISGYDECYPGFAESYDAMGDSDDETDFSKMDMGNKKGPVGRWDFETQEEYGDYMSSLEAMPRAAYQYGVKKPEGRKTRSRIGGQQQQQQKKDDRAAVDRQLQQITSMINKRKQAGTISNASNGEGAVSGKKNKY